MHSTAEKPLTIGQLAELTGLSRKSIRYYEKEGLIPEAERSLSDYRLYDSAIVTRLRFIQKAKTIGFTLEEVRRILELTDQGKPCCDEVYAWSEQKLADLDEQIRFLQGLRAKLLEYQSRWKRQSKTGTVPEADICGLIESVELPNEGGISDGKTKS
jgi:MerR family transcriptional regulator, copper efflux regulator